jgi:acetylornithine/N-succinyldiaminopimelate aminotransferase
MRRLADEHGALLLLDEVQTGMGRTGKWFASEHEGVSGDAMALAKGLGGGFPIGALLLREKLNGALGPGSHGSTFGGNALASAAARTVIAVLEEEKLVEAARARGAKLQQGLAKIAAKYPSICAGERGEGLLRGLCLLPGVDARVALGKIRDRGVLLTIAGTNVLRFTPPLIISDGEIDEGLEEVDSALAEVAA